MITVLAVACAVATVHVFILFGRAMEDQTRKIQRDSGLNVVIIPSRTSLDDYWSRGYSEDTMPEEYMTRVHDQAVANRLIPLLRRRVEVGGFECMVTGIAGEVFKGGKRLAPVFGLEPEPGTCVVGGGVARALSLQRDSQLEFMGHTFRVAQVLGEVGTREDVVVYLGLGDAQALFGLSGRISEIQALECHCGEDVADPLLHLRETLEPLLPGTQVLRQSQPADARRQQRLLAERSLRVASPLVVGLCGLVVALLAALNVRERRQELGVLFALGHGPLSVGGLVLGRSVALGLLGAVLGSVGGAWCAEAVGSTIFKLGQLPIPDGGGLLLPSVLLAPAAALAASLVPVALAAALDPAEVLRRG